MASGSKDAGLRQIIDLRADYKSDAYRKRCEEFGISHYSYPVVRGGKLESMYEYMAHRDGKEPMPIETFRKRKEIIKELSRKSD